MQLSVWEKESFFAPKDLIIAGSGFVGLWCAYFLKKQYPKLSIAILERGIIPTGASTRNAGFACFGSLTELLEDTEKMGTDNMLQLVEKRYKGLQRIQKVFKKKQIDFSICGGYDLLSDNDQTKKKDLKEKIKWLNAQLATVISEKKVFQFADEKISMFGFRDIIHLVENKLEGSLHSGKLCQALMREVHAMGITLLNGIEITGFEKHQQGIKVYTSKDIELESGKLLVCTNAFAKQLLPGLDIIPARGQVLVTAPIRGLTINGTFHYDHGYYYFRNLGERLLIGGARNKAIEEETTTEAGTTNFIQTDLEQFLSHYILPGIQFKVTDRWSGIMGMGSEKMPLMKEVDENVFCAVRMSGMGVALAPEIGEKMGKMMFG